MNKPVNCGCGGKAIVNRNAPNWTVIYCEKCGIRLNNFDTEAEAITAWNIAMGAKDINISDKATVIIEPFTTDMNHVGYCMCGYLVNAEWKYCPSCGAKLEWSGWK